MTELKPCPFCGGEAGISEVEEESLGYNEIINYEVGCPRCRIETLALRDLNDVIKRWKTRRPAFDWKPIEELTAECGDVLLINDTNTYDIGCRRENRVVVLVSRRDSEPYEQDFRLDYFTHYALLTPPEVK